MPWARSSRRSAPRWSATPPPAPTCGPLAAQYADIVSLIPAALEPVPPPARLRRNLMAQVYAEASAAAPSPWWRRLVAAIPASRGITVLGVAAVAAAVLLGVWGVAGRRTAAPITYVVSGSTSQPLVTGSVTLELGAHPGRAHRPRPRPTSCVAGLRGLADPGGWEADRRGLPQPGSHRQRMDRSGESKP